MTPEEAPLDLDGLREIARAIESQTDPNRYRTATAYLDAFRPSTVLRLIEMARLGEAWQAAEEALPEGWLLDGVRLAGIAPSQIKAGWEAAAIGKWDRSSRSRPAEYGYGPTPAAALQALAAKLREAGT